MTVENTSTSSRRASLQRRAAYSVAAGAAACAATHSADAAVIYSGPQNIAIGKGFSQNLDLDGDSFRDIVLENYVFSGGNYQGAGSVVNPGRIVGFLASGLSYVSALAAGAPINSGTVGTKTFGSMAYGTHNPSAQFNTATGAFLGLSFPSGVNTYYGWVRVDINNTAGSFTIRDWGYDNSGAGINAGAGIVPEPTTLGLLAAGGAGLVSLRRKRERTAA
jgi:hypothetical protein